MDGEGHSVDRIYEGQSPFVRCSFDCYFMEKYEEDPLYLPETFLFAQDILHYIYASMDTCRTWMSDACPFFFWKLFSLFVFPTEIFIKVVGEYARNVKDN